MSEISEKTEELAKTFSLKMADKLEKGEISLDEAREKIHNFLVLAKEEKLEEIKKILDEV